MVRPNGESNSIHYFAYVGEYFLKHTVALHVVVKSLCLVPVDEGSGLGVIYCKSGTGDRSVSCGKTSSRS